MYNLYRLILTSNESARENENVKKKKNDILNGLIMSVGNFNIWK